MTPPTEADLTQVSPVGIRCRLRSCLRCIGDARMTLAQRFVVVPTDAGDGL